jgi:hypothetical protein
MSNARNLARLIVDSGGDVEVSSLGNVPPSNDASALTTGTLGSARLPAGSVLQVAQARKTDIDWSTTSSSFVPVTGLSVTITPTSTSSRFLAFASVSVGANWWITGGGYFSIQSSATGLIAGNGSDVWVFQYGADSGNGTQETMQWVEEGIDTPNTLSPVTYSVNLASASPSYSLFVNRQYYSAAKRGNSWITVMEIAA